MTRKILYSTLESASFNIFFQIFLRCTTFFLNAFVLRFVSQSVVGVMNVRLLLLESTILFLSREAFRRAALSQTESRSWPQIINLVWLTVPLSVIISIFFSIVWLYILKAPSYSITPHYAIGVWSISISCIIEMLAEPLFIVSQAFLFTKLKIALDFSVVFIRSAIFALWIYFSSSQAVVAFSAAQLIANSFYCIGYYSYFYLYIKKSAEGKKKSVSDVLDAILNSSNMQACENAQNADNVKNKKDFELNNEVQDVGLEGCENVKNFPISQRFKRRQSSIIGFDEPFPFNSLLDFLPRLFNDEHWIHPNSAKLTWSFFKQGILKQILTEGEGYVMTVFSLMSFKEQGIYNVVNNLGSLAARFLFRPIEDSMYFYFTQSVKRDAKIIDQNQDRMSEASTVLFQALKCIVNLGLVIFTFSQSYSSLLLYLYGGEAMALGQGPKLLKAHAFSVLLLGINGITECYAFSTMTTQQLNKYNYLMALFSLSFLFISWGFTKIFGSIGFTFANCCVMTARIAHSLVFIKSRYEKTSFKPLRGLIPDKYFLVILCIAFYITKITENSLQRFWHFMVGVVCFIMVVSTWSYVEKDLVALGLKKWKNRKSKEE